MLSTVVYQAMTMLFNMKDKIYSAYEGEIYGIAFFSYFIENYRDLNRIHFFTKLVDVEVLTAGLLSDWLSNNGVRYDAAQVKMQSKGISDAQKWIQLDWPLLVKTLEGWVKPYELKYRAWFKDATDHLDAFKMIADHETAIHLSLRSELKGESGLIFLERFIDQYSNLSFK